MAIAIRAAPFEITAISFNPPTVDGTVAERDLTPLNIMIDSVSNFSVRTLWRHISQALPVMSQQLLQLATSPHQPSECEKSFLGNSWAVLNSNIRNPFRAMLLRLDETDSKKKLRELRPSQ
ncbi:hypothetical protein [Leptolyngbya sp. KIOST-1]|uniref:hypothetical protein n=1 Tax=Leptolyngbya sp. KIOST-1 TaxID=1229172 RepID=UPI0012E0135E|nr:hypothetical protein [Leptolyngbya sp. KIOST-1]